MKTKTQTRDFFARPSLLSTGEKNRRFKGSIKSYTYGQACSDQSGTNDHQRGTSHGLR